MINRFGTYKSYIDNDLIIYIFKSVFISSYKLILIKNGVGNWPNDAVATDLDFVKMSGAKSCLGFLSGKDEMKKSPYLFISSEEVFCFKQKENYAFKIRNT
jgi:hypothetical protein